MHRSDSGISFLTGLREPYGEPGIECGLLGYKAKALVSLMFVVLKSYVGTPFSVVHWSGAACFSI